MPSNVNLTTLPVQRWWFLSSFSRLLFPFFPVLQLCCWGLFSPDFLFFILLLFKIVFLSVIADRALQFLILVHWSSLACLFISFSLAHPHLSAGNPIARLHNASVLFCLGPCIFLSKPPSSPVHSLEWLFLISSYHVRVLLFFLPRTMLFLPRDNWKNVTHSHSYSFVFPFLPYNCFFHLFQCRNCTHICPTNLLSPEQPCTHPVSPCLLLFSLVNLVPHFKIDISLSDLKKTRKKPQNHQTFHLPLLCPCFCYFSSQLTQRNSLCLLCEV